MGYVCKKNWLQYVSKISQSGHTDMARSKSFRGLLLLAGSEILSTFVKFSNKKKKRESFFLFLDIGGGFFYVVVVVVVVVIRLDVQLDVSRIRLVNENYFLRSLSCPLHSPPLR